MAVPRGRLNQAAASSVCSVIVGRADQVVSEGKQAGMWLAEDRGRRGRVWGVNDAEQEQWDQEKVLKPGQIQSADQLI